VIYSSCSASSQHQGQSDSRQTSLTKGLNKKAKEEEVIKLAIAEYKENEEKKETANEKTDRAYKERVKEVITEAGRSEDYVESDPIKEKTFKMKGPSRPTSIKAHRKHLSPETLDFYDLPWQWDDVSSLTHSPISA